MLEIIELQASYGSSKVLFGVNFKMEAGAVTTLLGRNGMGKSSTVRAIMGLLPCTSGSIRFNDREIHELPSYKIARLGIGLVPEGRQIFPNLTVRENLIVTAANYSGSKDPYDLDHVLSIFPKLSDRLNAYGNQLSGGEQQMLAFARALMINPSVLILDEATEGLAPLIREEIWRGLTILKGKGQTILVIDKNLDALLRIGDYHHIMEKGRVVWSGNSEQLARDESLKTRYLGVSAKNIIRRNAKFRGYTADQLQAQYSVREAIPNHLEIFDDWQKTSAEYRSKARVEFNISYGKTERQKLDLFLPDKAYVKPPLLIFIHGGYWQAMNKDYFSFIAKEINRCGTAVAILNYNLCPKVTLAEITNQIRRAVIWLAHNVSGYGIDAERLHLLGHSAGGHLIAELIATDWQGIEPEFDTSVIRSGISISGVFELEPLLNTGINQALGLDLQSARQNSPVLSSPTLNIPLDLIVGGDEPEEFHRQSQHLANQWKKQLAVHYRSLVNFNHFTVVNELSVPDSLLLKFVNDSLKV